LTEKEKKTKQHGYKRKNSQLVKEHNRSIVPESQTGFFLPDLLYRFSFNTKDAFSHIQERRRCRNIAALDVSSAVLAGAELHQQATDDGEQEKPESLPRRFQISNHSSYTQVVASSGISSGLQ
jgi:hypothetical protein